MLTEPRYQYFNIPPHWPRYFSISHEIKTLTETLQSVCLSVSHGTGLIEGRLALTGELRVNPGGESDPGRDTIKESFCFHL